MDYTKEMLVDEAIKRLDTIDDVLESCQESLSAIYAEKQTARYLLWLGAEKKEKNVQFEL